MPGYRESRCSPARWTGLSDGALLGLHRFRHGRVAMLLTLALVLGDLRAMRRAYLRLLRPLREHPALWAEAALLALLRGPYQSREPLRGHPALRVEPHAPSSAPRPRAPRPQQGRQHLRGHLTLRPDTLLLLGLSMKLSLHLQYVFSSRRSGATVIRVVVLLSPRGLAGVGRREVTTL